MKYVIDIQRGGIQIPIWKYNLKGEGK